jgi:hypothetical protein
MSQITMQWLINLRQNVFPDGKAMALILDVDAAHHQQDLQDLVASARSVYDSPNGVWSVDEDEHDRGDDGEFVHLMHQMCR